MLCARAGLRSTMRPWRPTRNSPHTTNNVVNLPQKLSQTAFEAVFLVEHDFLCSQNDSTTGICYLETMLNFTRGVS